MQKLVDLESRVFEEPPISKIYNNKEWEKILSHKLELPQPCQNQVIARHIKFVSGASPSICGHNRCDGHIR